MINVRACDLCHTPLGAQVTRLEFVHGAVTFLPRDRWSVEPTAAGIRVRMVCPSCDQFLREAVQHLISLVRPAGATATPTSVPASPTAPQPPPAAAGDEPSGQHAVA